MEDIPVIVPQLPTENVYVKAVINGLGATIILWTFWTPFIIFLARPLVNTQIKQYTCGLLSYLGSNQAKSFRFQLNMYLDNLVNTGVITQSQRFEIQSILQNGTGNSKVAKNVVNQNPQKNLDDNFLIIVLFVVTYFLIILCSSIAIYVLSSWFSISMGPIYTFNAVMALIFIAIEASFFGAVAMQFVPFDIQLIIEQTKFKLNSYLSELGSEYIPYVPPPPCAFQPPLQDYYIGDWIQPTTNFGSLDEAQQRCLLSNQCVGVTTSGDGNYILTTTRIKYQEIPGSQYHNQGSTSWVLNNCK
jgi:hypothetical protein